MEVQIISENKKRMEFVVDGEDHTFCNALKCVLVNTDGVINAAYSIDHPLVGKPKFVIETKGEPRKILMKAVQSLKKEFGDFKKKIEKEL